MLMRSFGIYDTRRLDDAEDGTDVDPALYAPEGLPDANTTATCRTEPAGAQAASQLEAIVVHACKEKDTLDCDDERGSMWTTNGMTTSEA